MLTSPKCELAVKYPNPFSKYSFNPEIRRYK